MDRESTGTIGLIALRTGTTIGQIGITITIATIATINITTIATITTIAITIMIAIGITITIMRGSLGCRR